MKNTYEDAESFASVLKRIKLKNNLIKFDNFTLDFTYGVNYKIEYNEAGIDLLNNQHQYTFKIPQGDLQLSLQLYENVRYHYRLFAFTRIGSIQGMVFSVNLTTQKESNDIIFLTQKIKFTEQHPGDNEMAKITRKQKQILLCDIYRKMGLEVTENNDLILGIFNPIDEKFVNTSAEDFLYNFITVSILKGHFQGNKGYSLDMLPSYQNINLQKYEENNNIENVKLSDKISKQKKSRNIPLSLRYQVLKRDNSKCVVCGRSVKDGVILHVDHIIPFSLGGLTTLDNLQTLCAECNIGKSNRILD
ncbi:MAG: HNH endonuclease [Oscillospiraceae bacterium]|nr:HNH endonuclease [Oscillospiraceae bacterium]